MDIAIIEHQKDIDEAVKYFPPQDCLYLSASAEASYHLSKRNIKFLTDEEVLTPTEFKERGNENFEITEEWIRRLEETLQSKNPIFKRRQFYPFKWNFYRFKILVDAVCTRKILIERLIEKEKPSLIGTSTGTVSEKIHNYHLYFHHYDSLYGLLVKKIASKKKIEIKTWRNVNSASKNFLNIYRIKTYLRRFMRGLSIALEPKDLFKSMQPKDNILLGILHYDIWPIMKKLSNRFNFYFYEKPLCIRSLNSLLKLKSEAQSHEFPEINFKGTFKDINPTGDLIVDEILSKRVQNYAERFIPILWKGLNYIESIDHKKKFKAYIDIVGACDSFQGLPSYYFNKEKKSVIYIQHGSYGVGFNRYVECRDFGHDGWFFAWGEGIKEMYEEREKASCKIISTGSHLIEEIKKESKPRKTISKICYVPNSYRGYTAYYPNGQPCLDSRMFIMETNSLMALKPYLERYQITYKVPPDMVKESPIFGKNPMLSWIKENLPSIRIKSNLLQSIIHEFDLFIIDWPNTTLIQACATGAEVVVYIGNEYKQPTREAIELLRKRAIIAESEKDFQDKISKVLEKGIVISNVEDTSFIERYGICRDDGRSLNRIINNIEDILEEKKE